MYRRRVLSANFQERQGCLNLRPCQHESSQDNLLAGDSALLELTKCLKNSYEPHDMNGAQKRKQQRRMLHDLHRCMARCGAVAVAASASALSRGLDRITQLDEVSKFRVKGSSGTPVNGGCSGRRSRWNCMDFHASAKNKGVAGFGGALVTVAGRARASAGSAALGAGAQIVAGVRGLASAIGEPPRPLDESQETPLALFWAFNLLVLCCMASAGFIIAAFILQLQLETDNKGRPEPVGRPDVGAAHFTKPLRLSFRVVSVAAVSFLSGMGLRVIHPVQSALLCGV